jgi:hypothetical protein
MLLLLLLLLFEDANLFVKPLRAKGLLRATQLVERFNEVGGEGALARIITKLVLRRTSCNCLFHTMAAGSCGVWFGTRIKKQEDVGLGIFEQTLYTVPFKLGGIFASIAKQASDIRDNGGLQ